MKYVCLFIVTMSIFSPILYAQEDQPILPTQANAIRDLAVAKGFTQTALTQYISQQYNKKIHELNRKQAAELITQFQSANPPAPPTVSSTEPQTPPITSEPVTPTILPTTTTKETQVQPITPRSQSVKESFSLSNDGESGQLVAQFLELGMSKRFHLVDGNIILGTIVKIDSGLCSIETLEGVLKIPTKDILEETAEISKRDDTRFVGPVIKETMETISIRSKYGDIIVDKKEIRDMNRYHGGKLVPWAEEKKRFYRSQVSMTDIFMDPTAFPLEQNALYISGLSIGYGFTERFMVRTSFGNNFNGDLNLKPLWQFYYDRMATSRTGIALGVDLYSRHDMSSVLANLMKYIKRESDGALMTDPVMQNVSIADIISPDYKSLFYADIYLVYSTLWSLESGRGEMGYHFGVKTSTLPFVRDKILRAGYKWTDKNMNYIPYRVWGAFEYDLTKSLKFAANVWADNGYRYRTFNQVSKDYFSDSTPFTLDAKGGENYVVDFDFGFLYAVNDSFRFGVHFKEAYLVFFWRILEL